MIFQDPWILILIPVAAAVLLFSIKGERQPALRFSTGSLLSGLKPTLKLRLLRGIIFLRILAVFLIIIAMARPQLMLQESRIETEGIDIVLAVDTSTSMLAEDFELGGKRGNRLEVVRDVVKDFISNRKSDRMGIVAFAAHAYTVAPLTLDYGWLMQNLERVKIGMIEDGTAIGSGLSTALNRLKDSEAKGKVVILLTDGRNNAGRISPLTAADAARALNIKVYTIGAGTDGLAPYPAKDFFGNTVYRQVKIEIDEDTLKKIAQKTKALYYRATDTKSLRNIYDEIDRIEKTPIEEKGYTEYKEMFHLFLIPALVLLLIEVILRNTWLRRIP
ncbi:MAG: VWA domain-containing protein [Nitrospiraceae bacterium]|nr:MAG: VWA domain-containing protein [Nitrospiraceae bacterium]